MKKNITWRWIVVAFVAVLLGGCTHNNGDIGPFFGTWKLSSITVDGVPDPDYGDNVVWKFQANVVAMVRINNRHETNESIGTWIDLGRQEIQMDFIYCDDVFPEGSDRYSPLAETHLPKGSFRLAVMALSSGDMKLRYSDPENGIIYEYALKKW